jgi:hypothetical protein
MAVAAQERGLLVAGKSLETDEWQEMRCRRARSDGPKEDPMHAVRELTGERLVVIAA